MVFPGNTTVSNGNMEQENYHSNGTKPVYDDNMDTSSTANIIMSEGDDDYNAKRRFKFAFGGVLAFTTIGVIAWMIVISAIVIRAPSGAASGFPESDGLIAKMRTLESRIQDLEAQASQRNHTSSIFSDDKKPSFAAVKSGEIGNGKLTYNETLYSYPDGAFSVTEGTFTVPEAGVYWFSFSGTSLCGENWVGVKVNNETTLRYYDRDTEWFGGPDNTTFGYFRGWTQQFALKLEVEDKVNLHVDCYSDESMWKNHQPNSVREHHNHHCFYWKANFYFFGQFMGKGV